MGIDKWNGITALGVTTGNQEASVEKFEGKIYEIVTNTAAKLGDIFSFDMMKLGGEAVSAFKLEFIDFWSILANFAVLAILIVIQVLLDKKLTKK